MSTEGRIEDGQAAREGLLESHASHGAVRCAGHHLGSGNRRGGGSGWTLHEEAPKFAPDRTCDVTHLRLEIAIDLPKRSFQAVASLDLRASYGPFDSLVLDAIDLSIDAVEDGKGRAVDHAYLGGKLTIRFPKPIAGDERITIRYHKEHPERGLYFWGPTPDEPRATWQMWSHGQEQEARHWIPCHDAPHEKMTTELLVTVPEAYTVVSNGALLEVGTRGKSRRWHFRESVPYSSYLITLVVGVFTKLEDECDGLPVEYYVEPGREEDGWRSFGRTPDMIRTFAAMLECPFPYEKYAQVAVRHFMFGGMENTSATTQTDGTLHDERAALDFTSDDLVAHELAHQWFGDLLTCQHWAHAWLNEGFATYFEAVWKEADQGADEFELGLVVDADAYLSESYRRAIVSYRFAYPFQLFDQHLYPKAAWVVHMLRRAVGDEAFWKAVRLYVRRHAARSVETIDLRRAFEEATGRNLEGFFDQWLFHPGHPELEIDCRWDESARALQVAVKQVQKGADAVVYRLPIEVAVVVEAGTAAVRKAGARRSARGASPASRAGRRPAASGDVRTVARMFELEHREQTFVLELPSRPVSVVIDPQARVLKTCKLEMPIEWVEGALVGAHRSTHVYARVELVRQIARKAAPRAVEILAKALRSDPCWGVQAEAATALGKVRTPAALAALLSELPKHPKARRAWVQALGEFRDAAAVDALTKIIRRGDPSYLVEREALVSLGRTRAADAIPRLEKALSASVKRRDWRDILMSGAVAGLAAARSESIEPILAVALDRSRYWATRVTALGALATIGSARPSLAPRIAEGMSPLFEDPEHLVMYRLPDAYASLGHQGAIPLLRRKANTTAFEELREGCLRAAEQLSAVAGPSGDLDHLKSELQRLLEETRALRERVDRLEEKAPARASSRARDLRARVVRTEDREIGKGESPNPSSAQPARRPSRRPGRRR